MEHYFIFLTSYTGQPARRKHFYRLALREKLLIYKCLYLSLSSPAGPLWAANARGRVTFAFF